MTQHRISRRVDAWAHISDAGYVATIAARPEDVAEDLIAALEAAP